MSNQLKKTVDVYYKEGVIAQIGSGQYGVINCKGDELEDNLIVKVPEDMTPVMFKDITGTVTVNGYVELLAEDGTAAKRVYLNIQVPSEYMLQGTYDSGYEYKIGDIVVYRGEVFVKIGEGQTEPVNGYVWQLFGGAIQDEKEVDIITYGKIEFEPDEGYVAMRKLTARVSETPKFDGTINIESGFTTISGSYLIDEQKAYDALVAFNGVKTFNVKFSAGGSGSGMGDSIDFTSMTFDGTYGFIKYNDKAAFAMNGGFAEYNNNYGDGNGARVQFEEGTECRKEFKELFLSIADEYVEESEDELAGTWVFDDYPSFTVAGLSYSVDFTSNRNTYNVLRHDEDSGGLGMVALYYGSTEVFNPDMGGEWINEAYKTINITSKLSEVTNGSTLLTWLKANATKQGAASLISFTIAGTSYQAEEGMTWGEWVASDYNTDRYAEHPNLGMGTEDSKVPAKNQYCITYNSTVVQFRDLIIANASYGLQYNTGAGGSD